ncbi:hypothetical protein [Kitasatospora kifunensis]|uniref:N-acetylglutamate synthase n=1 Tax=Kitasatospora kifunensis TaxID=58351 RepID=A0A7W7R4V4_KITKI|nr:hypothetical protein [Kitasatospora kifunensis]MBB4924896.1 hypothetical protein [Kitasatospora kifunensis]
MTAHGQLAGLSYNGRVFRSAPPAGGAPGEGVPTGHYHQDGDLVWAEFAGGPVRGGRLAGRCSDQGVLTLAYAQVLTDGRVVSGECVSTPELLADGRIRLREQWRRADGSSGTSWIEEPGR